MTIVGMTLVDRKGRKFLLTLGTSGIIVCLLFVGILFLRTEKNRFDVRDAIQSQVGPDQNLRSTLIKQTQSAFFRPMLLRAVQTGWL